MATEIERKFIVTDGQWRRDAATTEIRQGYLVREPQRTVRIRTAGDKAWLNIKGATKGISRLEFEYEISPADAAELLSLSVDPPIEKTRHRIDYKGHRWEIDEFHGANAGLLMAEIELRSEHAEFPLPPWVGKEVSDDPRYYNASLSKTPFSTW